MYPCIISQRKINKMNFKIIKNSYQELFLCVTNSFINLPNVTQRGYLT